MESEKRRSDQKDGLHLLCVLGAVYFVIRFLLNEGGILANVQRGTMPYAILRGMNIWTYCAADIFVLISAYIGYHEDGRKYDWPHLIELWLRAVFYGVTVSFIFLLLYREKVEARDIWDTLLPIANDLYPYFTAWAGLFFLRPLLDTAARNTDPRRLKQQTVCLFILFSVYTTLTVSGDSFHFNSGISLIWFTILYFIGASLKRAGFYEGVPLWAVFSCLILSILIPWTADIFILEIPFPNRQYTADLFLTHSSPFVTAAALMHVVLFARIKIPAVFRKPVLWASGGVFASYLLCGHRLILKNGITGRFSQWANRTSTAVLRVLLFALLIVFVSAVIDMIRQYLSSKLAVSQALEQLVYGPGRVEALRKLILPLYGIVFTAVWVLLFWKCRYGYAYWDETLYLAFPYRFLMGDGFVAHEWHFAQLFSFLTMPILWLYSRFFPTTEGILLNFRLIFTCIWGLGALFFFFRLRKYSDAGAALLSLVFLLYTPYGIMALSYNSLGILLLCGAGVILMTAERFRKIQYFLGGMLFAGAALCSPYLCVLYLIFSGLAISAFIHKKNRCLRECWLLTTAGILIPAVIFCAFVLSRAAPGKIAASIPIIFFDAEHPDKSVSFKLFSYFRLIWNSNPAAPFVLAGIALCCAASLFRKERVRLYFIAVCVLSGIYLASFLLQRPYLNYLMFPLSLPAVFCRIHTKDRNIIKIFRCLWLPGMLYTFLLNYSSNNGFYAISSAASVSTLAGLLILVLFVKELIKTASGRQVRIALIMAACVLFGLQLTGEADLRYNSIFSEFWPGSMRDQTALAESGPEKGIFMTSGERHDYRHITAEIAPMIESDDIQKVLFFTRDPVLYLCAEKEFASFSAWFLGSEEQYLDLLDRYYEMNPEKIPDAVFLLGSHSEYLPYFKQMGFTPSPSPDKSNYILLQDPE